MKKITVRIVSVLTFVILFASILSTPAFAISTYCVQNHFSMLCFDADGDGVDVNDDEIRTPPSENTCPYVAMSLLLTFYDSYWNDDFVADEYEWDVGTYNRSTDTLIETFAATTEAKDWKDNDPDNMAEGEEPTYENYRDYAIANADNYLEPYLISIGMLLGYHPETEETVNSTNEEEINTLETDILNSDGNKDNAEDSLGLTDGETVAVLEYYLFTVQGFSRNDLEVHYLYEDDGDIEAKMIEVIDDGYPLIYIGKKLNSTTTTNTDNEGQTKTGHELIAYGIDENNDILLHTGWKYESYRMLSNVEYNLNRAIIWLELKGDFLTHTHTENSGNYVDSITGEELCACQIYSSHPNHNSNHLYKNGADSDSHFLKCHCGEKTNISAHNFTYSYYNPLQHYKNCSECAYLGTAYHEYTIPNSPVEGGHSLKCACGATSSATEAHYADTYEKLDSSFHNVYCECGYLIEFDFHSYIFSAGVRYCSGCGYVKPANPGPGQVIMGEEDEDTTTE